MHLVLADASTCCRSSCPAHTHSGFCVCQKLLQPSPGWSTYRPSPHAGPQVPQLCPDQPTSSPSSQDHQWKKWPKKGLAKVPLQDPISAWVLGDPATVVVQFGMACSQSWYMTADLSAWLSLAHHQYQLSCKLACVASHHGQTCILLWLSLMPACAVNWPSLACSQTEATHLPAMLQLDWSWFAPRANLISGPARDFSKFPY